ncbi:MAG: alpha-glucan family phosphorylase, partial [Deltaproteobacteria bacterium]|nr:alpha-glucan family phosphorylase [Deltaproteobacteria bacterium]
MEVGIQNDIPTYSGGLGVLAGDTIRTSADLKLPIVAVTMLSKKGYFTQTLNNTGKQGESPVLWDPSHYMTLLPAKITVKIEGRDVVVQAWQFSVTSLTGGYVPIFFLDTDVEENDPDDREITSFLYGGDIAYRLKQEIVLGIGGVRMLNKLGFEIKKYHMNEGHSALLTFELLKENNMDAEKVQHLCVFTTHTPIEAAFDQFTYDLVKKVLGKEYLMSTVKQYAGQNKL